MRKYLFVLCTVILAFVHTSLWPQTVKTADELLYWDVRDAYPRGTVDINTKADDEFFTSLMKEIVASSGLPGNELGYVTGYPPGSYRLQYVHGSTSTPFSYYIMENPSVVRGSIVELILGEKEKEYIKMYTTVQPEDVRAIGNLLASGGTYVDTPGRFASSSSNINWTMAKVEEMRIAGMPCTVISERILKLKEISPKNFVLEKISLDWYTKMIVCDIGITRLVVKDPLNGYQPPAGFKPRPKVEVIAEKAISLCMERKLDRWTRPITRKPQYPVPSTIGTHADFSGDLSAVVSRKTIDAWGADNPDNAKKQYVYVFKTDGSVDITSYRDISGKANTYQGRWETEGTNLAVIYSYDTSFTGRKDKTTKTIRYEVKMSGPVSLLAHTPQSRNHPVVGKFVYTWQGLTRGSSDNVFLYFLTPAQPPTEAREKPEPAKAPVKAQEKPAGEPATTEPTVQPVAQDTPATPHGQSNRRNLGGTRSSLLYMSGKQMGNGRSLECPAVDIMDSDVIELQPDNAAPESVQIFFITPDRKMIKVYDGTSLRHAWKDLLQAAGGTRPSTLVVQINSNGYRRFKPVNGSATVWLVKQ